MKRSLVLAFMAVLAVVSGPDVLAKVEDVRVIDRLREGEPYQKIWLRVRSRILRLVS